jgi:hypothetical protein
MAASSFFPPSPRMPDGRNRSDSRLLEGLFLSGTEPWISETGLILWGGRCLIFGVARALENVRMTFALNLTS